MNCLECKLPQCTLDNSTVNRCIYDKDKSDYNKDYYKDNADKIKSRAKERYRNKMDKKYLDTIIDSIGGM